MKLRRKKKRHLRKSRNKNKDLPTVPFLATQPNQKTSKAPVSKWKNVPSSVNTKLNSLPLLNSSNNKTPLTQMELRWAKTINIFHMLISKCCCRGNSLMCWNSNNFQITLINLHWLWCPLSVHSLWKTCSHSQEEALHRWWVGCLWMKFIIIRSQGQIVRRIPSSHIQRSNLVMRVRINLFNLDTTKWTHLLECVQVEAVKVTFKPILKLSSRNTSPLIW